MAVAAFPLAAQRVFTLDSCRSMALAGNKQLLAGEKEIEAAGYEHKAARANYLFKVNAVATYFRNSREQHLLSSSTRSRLDNLGTSMSEPLGQLAQTAGQLHPEIAGQLEEMGSNLVNGMNNIGRGINDAFRTDTRNVFAGALMLTQPIYMGGKIRAYDQITGYACKLIEQKHRVI